MTMTLITSCSQDSAVSNQPNSMLPALLFAKVSLFVFLFILQLTCTATSAGQLTRK